MSAAGIEVTAYAKTLVSLAAGRNLLWKYVAGSATCAETT